MAGKLLHVNDKDRQAHLTVKGLPKRFTCRARAACTRRHRWRGILRSRETIFLSLYVQKAKRRFRHGCDARATVLSRDGSAISDQRARFLKWLRRQQFRWAALSAVADLCRQRTERSICDNRGAWRSGLAGAKPLRSHEGSVDPDHARPAKCSRANNRL